MRKLLLAAAVVMFSAACHNRNEDEVGAAPEQGEADTAATTHVIDSTRTGPPGVGGRPGNATVTPDSVGVESGETTGLEADTTMMHHDSTMMHGDTAAMDSDTPR